MCIHENETILVVKNYLLLFNSLHIRLFHIELLEYSTIQPMSRDSQVHFLNPASHAVYIN